MSRDLDNVLGRWGIEPEKNARDLVRERHVATTAVDRDGIGVESEGSTMNDEGIMGIADDLRQAVTMARKRRDTINIDASRIVVLRGHVVVEILLRKDDGHGSYPFMDGWYSVSTYVC